MIFQDRSDAGRKLGAKLQHYRGSKNCVAVGLARGGVVVAAEIASALGIPLDVIIVRKVGAPENEELALGAIADEGKGVFNDHLIAMLGVSKEYLKVEVERQRERIKQAKSSYLKGHLPIDLAGKTVILVDDGIATGASMKVAIHAVRAKNAKKIVLAVPVAAADSLNQLATDADEIVCLYAPSTFYAVGAFYKDFAQTTDEEVAALIQNQ